jgi:hypothetical protein
MKKMLFFLLDSIIDVQSKLQVLIKGFKSSHIYSTMLLKSGAIFLSGAISLADTVRYVSKKQLRNSGGLEIFRIY